jgi:hypothetical protein
LPNANRFRRTIQKFVFRPSLLSLHIHTVTVLLNDRPVRREEIRAGASRGTHSWHVNFAKTVPKNPQRIKMNRLYRSIALHILFAAATSAHAEWICKQTQYNGPDVVESLYCTLACWIPSAAEQCVTVRIRYFDVQYLPPPPPPVVLPRPTLSETDRTLIDASRVKADCEAKGGYAYPASLKRLSAFIAPGREKSQVTVATSIDVRVLSVDGASITAFDESMVEMEQWRVLLNSQSMSLPIVICSNSNGTSLLGAEITP